MTKKKKMMIFRPINCQNRNKETKKTNKQDRTNDTRLVSFCVVSSRLVSSRHVFLALLSFCHSFFHCLAFVPKISQSMKSMKQKLHAMDEKKKFKNSQVQ